MSTSLNFDHLPAKILSFNGYEFFQYIKTTLGEPEADLLNKISIKTTASFLAVEDPLEIFNFETEDEDLERLKEKLCFKLKNHKFMIKPGVISGFRSLRAALQKKINEQQTKSKKKTQQRQESSNTNSSFMSSLQSTEESTTTHKKLSLSEHKQYVLKFIKKWCADNKENFGLENFNLEENDDFTLNINLDQNSDEAASIKCKCGKSISLAKNNSKIQVSNYYKHLLSKGCDHIKNIKKAAKDSRSTQEQASRTMELTSNVPISSSSTHQQLNEVDDVSPTSMPTSHTESQVISNQSMQTSKRRMASQSQHSQPAKRSRM